MKIPPALTALVSGLVFGYGLILSGMTDPARVLAFLDLAGQWNPALAVVMGCAIMVAAPVFLWMRRRRRTLDGTALALDNRRPVDGPLVAGSVVFGIGWGLSGICPGPGLMLATGGQAYALVFVGMMALGMWLGRFLPGQRASRPDEG